MKETTNYLVPQEEGYSRADRPAHLAHLVRRDSKLDTLPGLRGAGERRLHGRPNPVFEAGGSGDHEWVLPLRDQLSVPKQRTGGLRNGRRAGG
jgi:hypothetical protein